MITKEAGSEMGIKRLIFNLMLKISRAKLRRGLSIYGVRSDYNIFGKVIRFLSKTEKSVKVNHTNLDGIYCIQSVPAFKTNKTILFLHGGAFVISLKDLKDAYIPFSTKLAQLCRSEVWMPDYRTAPENPFPLPGEDCLKCYLQLLKSGINSQDIILMGDSCGAALGLAMVSHLIENNLPLPSCIVTISAWADLSLTGKSLYTRSDIDPMFSNDPIAGFANHYLQGSSPRDPKASPLYADYTGFPPMLMMVGGREMLHDDTTRIAEKATNEGVNITLDIIEEMIHIYPIFYGIIPEGIAAIERIAQFISNKSHQHKPSINKQKKVV